MSALTDTFQPLRLRNLRIYFTGQVISLIGTWMQQTAQAWLVWELTGSESALGTVGMLATLPLLLLGPLAGGWADRFDRRRLLILTQFTSAMLALTLSGLVQFRMVQIWHVYLLASILGIVNALDLPAQQAILGDLSGVQMVRRTVVLNSMIVNVSRVLGPAMAGWLVKSIGTAPAFFFNGLSFFAVIASLLVIHVTQVRSAHKAGDNQFIQGVNYVRAKPRMQDLILFTAIVTFFGFSNFTILPAFVTHRLGGGVDQYGSLLAASGVGSLLSTLLLVPVMQNIGRPGLMLGVVASIGGAGFMLFSRTQALWAASLALVIPSAVFPIVLATANGLLQFLAPPDMRGRILTVYPDDLLRHSAAGGQGGRLGGGALRRPQRHTFQRHCDVSARGARLAAPGADRVGARRERVTPAGSGPLAREAPVR